MCTHTSSLESESCVVMGVMDGSSECDKGSDGLLGLRGEFTIVRAPGRFIATSFNVPSMPIAATFSRCHDKEHQKNVIYNTLN